MKTITTAKRIVAGTVFLAAVFICILPARAATTGTSGGLLLVTTDTARTTALGGAGGSVADDPGVVFHNPAGLYSIKRSQGLFTHQMGLVEDYSEILNFVLPLSDYGVFGVTFVYHGMSDLDDAGPGVEPVRVSDILGMISMGRSGEELFKGFSYGASLKFLNSVIGEYSANTFALDVGVHWRPAEAALVGLAATNAGLPLKFIDEADPLPLRITLSGKYELMRGFLESLFLVMDVEQSLENETRVKMGGEFVYSSIVAGRIGYVVAPGSTDGLAFGLGIRTGIGAYSFRLDYTYKMASWSEESLDGTHLFSVGLIY